MVGKRWGAGLSAMAHRLVRRSTANGCRPVTAPSERASPIALHVLTERMNEDDGESDDPVPRPRRRCVYLACSRLATPLALPRRPSLTARFVLPRHARKERTHACAADLHQTR